MKEHIDSLLAAATAKIAQCQDLINSLHKFSNTLPPATIILPKRTANPNSIKVTRKTTPKAKRKDTRRADVAATPRSPIGNGGPAARALDKPDTLSGAMKLLLQGEHKFTRQELRENLLEDADYKALLEGPTGEKQFDNALIYWLASGRLTKEGRADNASYTITQVGQEFFQ